MEKFCFLRKLTAIALTVFMLVMVPGEGFAANLGASLLTTTSQPLTNSSFTFSFRAATTSLIKEIQFQFNAQESIGGKPASLDLTASTWGDSDTTGLFVPNWSFNSSSAGTGVLKLTSASGETLTASQDVSIKFNTIRTPEIGDCSVSGAMYDTCYVHIRTFSDAGVTMIDSDQVSYQIEDEPTLTFKVDGVEAGILANGVWTTVPTNYNQISFGKLEIREPKFGAHRLRVETTAANGYTVNMKLRGYMQGLNPANKIDPFAAVNAAWNTPQFWTSPTSNIRSEDTGWIGASTGDSRVSGWNGALAKFGPVSTAKHAVMYSDGKDYGTEVYVTYGIEVNEYQPYDIYAGTLVYEVTATY